MIKECSFFSGSIRQGTLLLAALAMPVFVRAAVTYTVPAAAASEAAAQPNQDDWFAEIDDMIEEMVVPASPAAHGEKSSVEFETNGIRRTVQRRVSPGERRESSRPRRFVAQDAVDTESTVGRQSVGEVALEPTVQRKTVEQRVTRDETDAALDNAASVFTAQASTADMTSETPGNTSSSIIQEILRSDYWLEADYPSAPASPSAIADTEQSDVEMEIPGGTLEVERQVETPYSASPVESLSENERQSAETQLLSLERELLQDLGAQAEAAEETPEQTERGGMSMIEADLMTEQPDESIDESEQPEDSEDIENELLAELDSFIQLEEASDREPERAEVAQEDELFDRLMQAETDAVTEPDPSEVDAALEIAEKREPALQKLEEVRPSALQDARIEELNEQLNAAIARGDREAIVELSNAMAQRVGQLKPQKQPQDKLVVDEEISPPEEPQVASVEPVIEPPRETEPAHLANPKRHLKRFSATGVPDENTPMQKQAQQEMDEKPVREPAKRFDRQQVLVMKPSGNQMPLQRPETDATEPQSGDSKGNSSSAVQRARPVAMPEMRAFPKVDTSVFLRSAPASEARVQQRPSTQDDGSRKVRVVVPSGPASDSLDAPVPLAW